MALHDENGARAGGYAPRRADDNSPDLATLTEALVAALENALLVARHLLGAVDPITTACPGEHRVPPGHPACALSRREMEVLRLLAAGLRTRQIAASLHVSPRTVQRHTANLYLKIGAHNQAAAVAYALRRGLA